MRPNPHWNQRRTRAREALLLLILAASLAIGGCKGGDAPGAKSAAGDGVTVGTDIGQQAPGFDLPRVGTKGDLALADLRGKVVVMSFWASWCGPCRVEIPELESTWQRLKDKDVVVLGVSLDDKKSDATEFLTLFPVSYPMVLDAGGGKVGDPWRVSSIPMTIVLDKNGIVRRKHLGYTPSQLVEILGEVEALLEET